MKSVLAKILILLAGLLGAAGCSPAPNKSLTIATWINKDVDVAFIYLHLPDGRQLWRDWLKYPYRSDFYGWQTAGPEMLAFVRELPEYVMVSWRLPSPKETPYHRCQRRMPRENCDALTGDRNKGAEDYEDGQLIGPFKVPILSRLDPYALKMLERGSGDFNTLQIGLGIGSENINFRWILIGTPPPGKTADNNTMELSRGGDW